MMLKIGDKAPDIITKTESGTTFKLKDYRGKKVALVFYVKDNTGGCQAQLCDIRDNYVAFKNSNIMVLGISGGTEKTHQSFKDKNNIQFPLLMDEDLSLAKSYGVYEKKKMYGKEYMGIVRTTFLIDENGKIEAIFGAGQGLQKVKTKEHGTQLAEFYGLKL
ncbi:MAG: peroxiredoxin [Candidatus Thorarchaeota archaeon]|nr:MAG: peroxiredoxin [Candidatus Thorarchaeota archaeon]